MESGAYVVVVMSLFSLLDVFYSRVKPVIGTYTGMVHLQMALDSDL